MANPFGLNWFLQPVLVFVISVFFIRLLFWKIWFYRNLPPGPPAWPIVGNLLQLKWSAGGFERSVKKFHKKYGPIFTMWLGSRPMLMIATRDLAHEALIQKGSIFADRPPALESQKLFNSNQHSINSAAYGALWRSLRRNMARLYDEIVSVTGRGKPVDEDDLQRMPFLVAVVKETLRRHPPGHFVISHAVTRPCELAGYEVPANASVNFYVASIGMDPQVWQNPSEFRPERFADEGVEVDLTGTKEIKMIPFGAGRRVCPGLGMAMLHLNLIVARLVEEFQWECKPGETVDLSEAKEFTTVMKYPLQAVINDREMGHK